MAQKLSVTPLPNFIQPLSVFPMELNSGCNQKPIIYTRAVNFDT